VWRGFSFVPITPEAAVGGQGAGSATAELQAHSMINEWLQKRSGISSRRKSNIADAKRKLIAE